MQVIGQRVEKFYDRNGQRFEFFISKMIISKVVGRCNHF